MKLRITICFLTGLILWGCTSTDKGSSEGIVTFDIVGNMEHEDFGSLEEIFTLKEELQPEFTDSTIIYSDVAGIAKGAWYFANQERDQRLMVFGKDGKTLASFSHVGEGPEDYGDLIYTAVSPKDGDWYILNMRGRAKIKRYTRDGIFTAESDTTFGNVIVDGDRVVALSNPMEYKQFTLYKLDDDMRITDSLATGVTRYWSFSEKITTLGRRGAILSRDTVYSFRSDDSFGPVAIMELGAYAPEEIPQERLITMTGEELRAHHDKYIYTQFASDGTTALVGYKYGTRYWIQAYDMATGDIRYSRSGGPEIMEGLPFTTPEGKKYNIMPTGDAFDSSIIFIAVQDEETTDANPLYLRLSSSK